MGSRGSLGICLGIILLMALSALSLIPGANAAGGGGYNWEWQNPLPQGNPLCSVSALDESHVWAVGFGGAIVFYDGTSWSLQDSGTTVCLLGVSALDANHVWAVGYDPYTEDNIILFYNGTTWSAQASGTTSGLFGVSAIDATHVWAVGYDGAIVFYDGTSWSPQTSGTTAWLKDISAIDASHVWVTGDTVLFYDGTSWIDKTSEVPLFGNGIFALDATHVWAVGGQMGYWELNGYIRFYDGTSCNYQKTGTDALKDVSALDATHVWAVGYAGTILFYNGTTWSQQSRGGASDQLYSVSALDESHVWAIGFKGPTILFSSDGGTNWNVQTSGNTNHLLSVSVLDASHVWAVGYNSAGEDSALLFFDGTSWAEQASGTTAGLHGISAFDANHVWAVGGNGVILFYNGVTWSTQTSGTTAAILSVSALDAHHVWAVTGGGIILFYNGISWSVQMRNSNYSFKSVSALSPSQVWVAGGDDIFFYNGTSWSAQATIPNYSFNSISALDANHVWAVGYNNAGEGNAIFFYNSTSWSKQASGINIQLMGIFALAENYVWTAGDGGIIFYNGTSWNEQARGVFFGISALDVNNVWAVGLNGAILFGSSEQTWIGRVNASVSDGHGSVNPSIQNVVLGGRATIDITPDAGYHIASINVNGIPKSIANPFTIPHVSWFDDVVVTFAINTYSLDAGTTGNGSVVKAPDQPTYDHGTVVQLTANPAEGWHFVEWQGDLTGSDNPKNITMDAGKTVTAVFAINTYSLTTGTTGNGSAVKAPDQPTYDHGTVAQLTANPAEGWHFVEWQGDLTGSDNPKNITMDAGKNVTAVFAINTYSLDASVSGGHGTVTEATQHVNHGANATIHITPGVGYQISSIIDNGVPQTIANPYVISNITENHEVLVTFAEWPYQSFFAEGYTGEGFQEYLCLGNPGDTAANVIITYMFPDGTSQAQDLSVAGNSRSTINVNAAVGNNRDVSAKIVSDQQIVVERPMYFNYGGVWTGGHDTMGATSPSQAWYFAEGYTGPNFDEYICVLNPGDSPADLTFKFQTQEEGEINKTGYSVGPHSRGTFKINEVLGPNFQTALKLESTTSVVAERSMYFNYGDGWTGGHCVTGASTLSKKYYFSEGSTRGGFHEWLTLQNPNATPITIDATYQLGAGQGANVEKSYTIGAGERATVFVAIEVGTEKDVSVKLTSGSDFLAERPIYFNYQSVWTGGHCAIGASTAGPEWFFAEGYTGAGFNEWLCLQNPGTTESTVEITYLTQEEGVLPARTVKVPAGSRSTVFVNTDAGENYQLSVKIKVTDGPDVVVERPMYFNYGGQWTGGHDVVGYKP